MQGVDTTPFRWALWYYVLRLYGVCFDDFPYHTVNTLLNKEIKSYAKKVAAHPSSATAKV